MDNILFFDVPKEYDGAICKDYLKKHCNISSRLITKLVNTENGITRDGKLIRTIDLVHFGDTIEIKLPSDNNEIEPVSGELDIKFEDNRLIWLFTQQKIIKEIPLQTLLGITQSEKGRTTPLGQLTGLTGILPVLCLLLRTDLLQTG